MPDEPFTVEGSLLTVHAELGLEHAKSFRDACEQLLYVEERRITVDMSAVNSMPSLLMGTLAYLWVEGVNRDKEMQFLVSAPVAALFEQTGLAKIFKYRIADPG
jgi:anti-anti-sigma factor